MSKLTIKQEAFCLSYIETGNASEAYRTAYDAENCKPETINSKASILLSKVEIGARLEEIQKPIRERAEITLESHLERLKHLSNMAEAAEQYSAAIKAEESRGKASGLYVNKTELTGKDGAPLMPDSIKVIYD